jgi:hypothetical protein
MLSSSVALRDCRTVRVAMADLVRVGVRWVGGIVWLLRQLVDPGELARKHARRAIQALVRALNGSDTTAAVSAARTLLDVGYGAPVQPIALHAPAIRIECHEAAPEPFANGEDATDNVCLQSRR